MNVENQTPFSVSWAVLFDKNGAERLVVTVKATWQISPENELALAPKQEPPRPAEEFHGEPGLSSIRYESEMGPAKLATDVALVGSAVAVRPDTRIIDVSFRVGPLHKRLRVFGHRQWGGMLGFHSASDPEPFERVPLIYENAFGGKDVSAKDAKHHGWEPGNPVGRGFIAKSSQLKIPGLPLPNIESPDEPITRPGKRVAPQGFGFIGRDWHPRVGYVGTYDDAWTQDRMPLLPADFNERYHSAAHPDLVANGFLKGDEPVEVAGCTSVGRLAFNLPGSHPTASVVHRHGSEPIALNLNTILLDTEAMKLTLLWKGDLNAHRRLLQFRRIECRLPRKVV